MKLKPFFFVAGIIFLLTLVVISCKKDPPKSIPSLSTTAASNITSTSATSGGTITSDGGAPITSRGVCWDINQNPTILSAASSASNPEILVLNAKTTDGSGTGSYVSSLAGLNPGTTYYARAYATNSVGTAYGNQITINALAILPALTTTEVSAITSTTATSGGNITSEGGASVTSRGVCWGTTQNPTIADNRTTNGMGIGSFVSSITGLIPGTTYYARAYATNSVGTAYGNQITITTTIVGLPIISTSSLSAITSTTATCGGNISSSGDGPILFRGVCWSTNQNPTTLDNKTTDGSGVGSFTSAIIGLLPVRTYYVRAYAINSIGTAYGEQLILNTLVSTPIISTTGTSSITSSTITCEGYISSDGGASVTSRGVCWSTNQNPTITDSKTTNGSGIGSFTSLITGLNPITNYYIRAYATNSAGTTYGNQLTISTINNIPTLTTTSIYDITPTTATGGGQISSSGDGPILFRGVCWSTTPNPTISNNKTIDGSGTGSFSSSITGLIPGTTYYARAYATNSVGTAYGSQLSFTSRSYISDADGNVYTTVIIGTQTWMGENLKTTKYNDGTSIPLVTDNTAWKNLATPGYCWYNNQTSYKEPYGALYNWHAVNTGKLCPSGWHVSTDADWATLTNYLQWDERSIIEKGTTHWPSPNAGATNSTGFTALPGGYRVFTDGTFANLGIMCMYWTANESAGEGLEQRIGGNYYNFYVRNRRSKQSGYSVRCVKDN